MKLPIWYGIGALLLAGPARAQSLTGVWQGVEGETGNARYWPAMLRLQKGSGSELFGVLYEEVGGQPGVSATFQMKGPATGTRLRLDHVRLLDETGRMPGSYWCQGSIAFTYDAALDKLTGKATYTAVGTCDTGTYTFFRIRLLSAAAVPAGVQTTVRVSGRTVVWYADAELKRPVATGNAYRTRLSKTTTFYLKQGYYPTAQSPVVPITVRVAGRMTKPELLTPPSAPAAALVLAPALAPIRPDSARPAPLPAGTPMVLPAVLFRVGTAELLPSAGQALDQLAAAMKASPGLRLRIGGHADRMGEPEKNLALSEQRAAAVRAYLVQAGIASERLSAVGYGDARPLYPSPDARNRRVEVEAMP